MALTRLPNDAHGSYVSLKVALKEIFEPSSKREVYKAEFENRWKRNTESWGDFGDEMLQLVDKAFPALQQEAKERLATWINSHQCLRSEAKATSYSK